jgi:hypothetical protein
MENFLTSPLSKD